MRERNKDYADLKRRGIVKNSEEFLALKEVEGLNIVDEGQPSGTLNLEQEERKAYEINTSIEEGTAI